MSKTSALRDPMGGEVPPEDRWPVFAKAFSGRSKNVPHERHLDNLEDARSVFVTFWGFVLERELSEVETSKDVEAYEEALRDAFSSVMGRRRRSEEADRAYDTFHAIFMEAIYDVYPVLHEKR